MLKQSSYLRISVVNTCNLSCFFCHNEGAPITGEKLSLDELEYACKIAKTQGFSKFKLTGGEPTIRKDIIQLVERLSALELDDFSMITNGTKLTELAKPLKDAGLQRINVSLHTLDVDKYNKMMVKQKVSLEKIIDGIDHAIEVGFTNMKINFVYTGLSSDKDLEDLIDFVTQRSLTLVVLPVIEKSSNHRTTLNELYEKITQNGVESEKVVIDNEGIMKRLITLKTGGVILLRDDELSEQKPYHFCDTCKVKDQCREGIFPLRLSASGSLIPCLASHENRISIKKTLTNQNESELTDAFNQVRNWQRDPIEN